MAKQKQSKRGKRSDERPARKRYNNSDRLARRKILNLIRCNGMSFEDAVELWTKTRKRPHGPVPVRIKNV